MQYKFDSKPLYSKIAKCYINFFVKPTKFFFYTIKYLTNWPETIEENT